MRRIRRRWFAIAGTVALFLALQGCSANRQVEGSAGYQGAPSDWGSSITFGVHTHGKGR